MSDVVEVLYRDTVVVESGDNKVIVIEPKVIINQSTAGGGTWGTITGDIGEQSDLITLFNTKENKNRTILDSDNFDEVIVNGKYSASYGTIMLDVANAYGQVFQRAVYQSTNEEKFRWQIGGEWNDWVAIADTDMLEAKVDKVAGKQLSTEDYTTAEKDKLAGIEAGAQANPNWSTLQGKPSTFPPDAHNHTHDSLDGMNIGDYQHITTDEKNLFLLSDRFRINATDFIGGTASPYQGIVIGGVPVIVKKFLNQNSYYYTTVRLPSDSVYLDNIRFILTESVMPTAGQYIAFTINGTLLRHTFNGNEVQNQMITTDVTISYDDVGNQVNTLTTSGTYLQKIGIVSMDFFYSRGI